MSNYAYAKISDANYNMATHEGDAKRRLFSQFSKILSVSPILVPDKYREQYSAFYKLVLNTINKNDVQDVLPNNLRRIQNRTAVKYIKLLIYIELELSDDF